MVAYTGSEIVYFRTKNLSKLKNDIESFKEIGGTIISGYYERESSLDGKFVAWGLI